MRKIERLLLAAIDADKPFKLANTEYVVSVNLREVKLHGQTIARWNSLACRWEFNLCGWNTPTTRSRLNAVAGKFGLGRLNCKNGQAMMNNDWPVGHDGWFVP